MALRNTAPIPVDVKASQPTDDGNTGNVSLSVEGTKLVITVDLTKNLGPSKSGKTNIVASTSGFVMVAPGISASLNVTKR